MAGSAALVILLILALYWARKPRYRRQTIMTANEREFHQRLLAACPDCEIWPQVPILALLRPEAKEGTRTFWVAFRRISNTRVDWVISQDADIVAIVELDDRSHDARKDAQRDHILKSCGYRVVRFQSNRKPDPKQIHEAIFAER
jgi:hypothetical protein